MKDSVVKLVWSPLLLVAVSVSILVGIFSNPETSTALTLLETSGAFVAIAFAAAALAADFMRQRIEFWATKAGNAIANAELTEEEKAKARKEAKEGLEELQAAVWSVWRGALYALVSFVVVGGGTMRNQSLTLCGQSFELGTDVLIPLGAGTLVAAGIAFLQFVHWALRLRTLQETINNL
jgi:hypothetical protein